MAISNLYPGWVNSDGLRVKFPADEAQLGTGGTFSTGIGNLHITEFAVDYAQLARGTSATVVEILDYDVIIPAGAVFEKVEFVVGGTAFDSASNDVALNFGLVKRSDFTTIVDADGLVDSIAKTTIDTPNATVVIQAEGSATGAGALLDDAAPVAFDSVVCSFWENHAPSQGTGILRLYWRG